MDEQLGVLIPGDSARGVDSLLLRAVYRRNP